MSGGHTLAMLIGNGLSIAFSDQLLLSNISKEMTDRFTSQYTGSDAVAKAMQNVANHQPTGDPAADFEVLIGAFGGQSDILDDLATFANLTRDSDPKIANAIQQVRDFVSEVQRRGMGHTLEIIAERTYSDLSRRQPLLEFFECVLTGFKSHVTVANLNYDTLVLSALVDQYSDILSDMANGRYDGGSVTVAGVKHPTWRLRGSEAEFMPLEQRRLRLLHLHGSLTFWRFGADNYRKLPVDAVRYSPIWETYRNEDTFSGQPQVVLANQHDKAEHVLRYPYNLAYDVAETDMKNGSHWLIVGYSFRDACVNDLLSRSWEARKFPPKILVVTSSDRLEAETVEEAFGWDHGSGPSNHLTIVRGGAFGIAGSAQWTDFASAF